MANGEPQPVSPAASQPPTEPPAPCLRVPVSPCPRVSASSATAWQPLTPAGVAAFARATLGRLLVVETVCASFAAGALVCLLAGAWFPVVREAIRKLPDQGVIRNGELTAPRLVPAILAENTLFAISVNPESRRRSTSVADVRVEFGKRECRVDGLLGALVFRYPKTWTFEFNRRDLEPWWGAWELMILGLAALLTVVSLLLLWALLGALYCWVPRALAFFADRQLSWAGSWRLASAALLPGALLMTLALFLYSLGLLDLVRFGIVAALHLVVGWVYLVLGALALAKTPVAEAAAENPFTGRASVPASPNSESRITNHES